MGNFKDDGDFMILCSERTSCQRVSPVLEECIRYRDRVRPQ
jgi:hypothetical protein